MEEHEINLAHGDWSATVAPYGASLRGVTWKGHVVASGYCGRAAKVGGEGDVLVPFPGRVGGGTYTFEGKTHELERNDKDGPNAIHGFVRTQEWQVTERTDDSATFTLDFPGAPGYPFALHLTISYALGDDGLICACTIQNPGPGDAPVAVGFHPYFAVGSETVDADTLTLPFDGVLEFEKLIPTGKVLGVREAGLDFREGKAIGATVLNHCFVQPLRDPDSLVRVTLTGRGRRVIVWMDDAFDYCVLFTGESLPEGRRRRFLAIEPMTCGSDALNHPEWGLAVLKPGQTLAGEWGVEAEEL